MTEMTQYDIGLVELNITNRNRAFLQTTFPNKIFEYIYAGLPVAVCDIPSLTEFAERYNVGRYFDLEGNIKDQLYDISRIEISENILEEQGLTMNQQAKNILIFYNEVVNEYKRFCNQN